MVEQIQECSPKVAEFYEKYSNNKEQKQVNINGYSFSIDARYKLAKVVGKGSYGVVASATIQQLNKKRKVAIKKIERAFEDPIYTKRTLRELKLMRLMKHKNIMGLYSIMLPPSRKNFTDIYCVSELVYTDLRELIKIQKKIPLYEVKYFLYQCLCGLKYIHERGIIHRDLKTRNILINKNLDLKICDFGLSRLIDFKEKTNELTEYVVTRWYRPPEVLLDNNHYTTAVDIWSMGVIFAEMLSGNQILPGKSSADQLKLILDLIGSPSEEDIKSIPQVEYQQYVKLMRRREPKDFSQLFPTANEEALDLLHQMLRFDFNKRISAKKALEHPFFADLHQSDQCAPAITTISPLEFEFEDYPELTLQQYKDLIYEEILLHHYPEFQEEYLKKIQRGKSVCQHILHNGNKHEFE